MCWASDIWTCSGPSYLLFPITGIIFPSAIHMAYFLTTFMSLLKRHHLRGLYVPILFYFVPSLQSNFYFPFSWPQGHCLSLHASSGVCLLFPDLSLRPETSGRPLPKHCSLSKAVTKLSARCLITALSIY